MVKYKFSRGKYPKKYHVIVYDDKGKKIATTSFGHQDYGQYIDRVPLKLYSHRDTRDKKRRALYHKRHNYKKRKYSSGWFSANFLW